jgi:outer membrane protein TolC
VKRPQCLVPIVVVGLATFAAAAVQARTLDRRSAVRAAASQNPQVAAARAQEAALQAQAEQAEAARWPLLTLTAGLGPALKATLVTGSTIRSVESQYHNLAASDLRPLMLGAVTLIQPIYTFGKIASRREAAEHGLRARQAQTRMQRADVAFEVARIYEGLLLARDADRFFRETIHWLDSTLQSTQDKLARNIAGVTERDVLRLQTSVALATMGRDQAEAGLAQARAGLRAYLGLPVDEEIAVAEDELVPIGRAPADVRALLPLAQANRPEVQALRQGRNALADLARAEKAGLYPDVFLLAFVDTAWTPGRDWIQTRFAVDPLNHFLPGALIGLRWQLQPRMVRARAREQQAQAEGLGQLQRWAEAGIPAEVRRAFEDVARARKDIEQGTGAVAQAKKWMVQASADYAVGLLDLREVADAVEAYATLRIALLQARFAHNVGMAALSKATGTLDGTSDPFYLAPSKGGEEKP